MIDPGQEDEALMRAFIEGADEAFDVLFERHAAAVQAMLLRRVGDPALADDLTQETFTSVIRGRSRFTGASRFRPWLYAIALNALRDHIRRNRRLLFRRPDELPVQTVEPAVRDFGMDAQVRQALQRLSDKVREVVMLHHFEELTFPELAHVLGISVSAARVRAHRGYVTLRQVLGPLWRGDEQS